MPDNDKQRQTMEAICKPDYDHRVEMNNRVEKEKERRKKEADNAERLRRRSEAKGLPPKKNTNEPKDIIQEEDEQEQEGIVLLAGFQDIYGVWFFGRLTEIVTEIARKRFHVELRKMMHVFVDADPKKVTDGVHDITVYTNASCLYKWTAQGYHRGLVVLADDDIGNAAARIYMKSGTWSWDMNNEDKARLNEITSMTLPNEA